MNSVSLKPVMRNVSWVSKRKFAALAVKSTIENLNSSTSLAVSWNLSIASSSSLLAYSVAFAPNSFAERQKSNPEGGKSAAKMLLPDTRK